MKKPIPGSLLLMRTIRRSRIGLSPTEKLVLLLMATYCDQSYQCFPSQEKIAADSGLSRMTVVRTVAKLKSLNILTVTRAKRTERNAYFIDMSELLLTARSNTDDARSNKRSNTDDKEEDDGPLIPY